MKGAAAPLVIERLNPEHDRASFECTEESLQIYLRQRARQDQDRRVTTVFACRPKDDPRLVLGYYSISSISVATTELPSEIARRLPRYPVMPGALIGRLAVDSRFTGQGLGRILLLDALHRCVRLSAEIAFVAVFVDALHETAARFYTRFGFIALPRQPLRLFMPVESIRMLDES